MKAIYLVIISIAILSACDRKTNFKNYLTLKDAAEDGAIEKGWIPDFLPISSTDIYESHDVDANQIAIKFSSQDSAFLSNLKIIDKSMHENASKVIHSVKLPEVRMNLSYYYLRCSQEGPGILATDGNGVFYYAEPAGSVFESECAAK